MNLLTSDGYTALTLALHLQHSEATTQLIVSARGVDLDAREPVHGEPAVATAMRINQLKLAGAMLQAGASTASRDNGEGRGERFACCCC